ncbi:MAG: response regulator [Thermodesulfovibrionales bacterium]|nr:response regulator [Thermodesulfovibrionales bacterium]
MRNILLVEDDPNDIELTIKALSDFNIANEIVIVRDGAEAIEYLLKRGNFAGRVAGNPAVILLDLKLPKVSGLEVLKQVRDDEQLRLIPVVILTSSREEKDLKEAYTLGTNAYVVKPVDFHQFAEAVKQVGAFWAIVNEPPPDLIPGNQTG